MGKYIIGDVLEEIPNTDEEFDVVHLDDAWARPYRTGGYGVEYPTHNPTVTMEIIDLCWEKMADGSWMIMDCDDFILPKIINHVIETKGNIAEDYDGDGFRKIGSVTIVDSGGEPMRNTSGMYFSNGGYSVVFAQKGDVNFTSTSARQITNQEPTHGWGTTKPTKPYREWLEGITDESSNLLVPCAGTAPSAIAMEQLYKEPNYICIDIEEEAKESFKRRLEEQAARETKSIEEWGKGC